MRTRAARIAVVALTMPLVLAIVSITAAPASGAAPWTRPVTGAVVRRFIAPLTRYGPGHLGVDFAAAYGTPVHAVGPGTVEFAGIVAGTHTVVIRHPGGRRTSYSFLAATRVRRGQVVAGGAVVGIAGGRGWNHDGQVLHLGLRIGDRYVDPMQLFGPTDLATRVHLADLPAGGERESPGWPQRPTATLASLPDRSGGIRIDDSHARDPKVVPTVFNRSVLARAVDPT